MSSTTDWNPSGHPVHRLIQYLDAAITAFNALCAVGRIPGSVITDEGFQYSTDEALDSYQQQIEDYNRVIDEIFVKHSSGPAEVKRHLQDSCVAYLVRQGRTDLEVPIRSGCETLGSFFPHPKGDLACPGVSNRGVERFLKAKEVRDKVVSVLAKIGEEVPEDIRRRLQKENMEAGKLPTTDELLTWVRAARPSTELVVQSVAPGKVTITKPKSRGGRRPLVETNPQLVNLYDLVLSEWSEGRSWDEIAEALQANKDVSAIAKVLTLEINDKLIRNAKKYRNANPKS